MAKPSTLPKLYSLELQNRYPRAWTHAQLERLYRSAEITGKPVAAGHGATVYEGIGRFQKAFNGKGELALLFAELSENIEFGPVPEAVQQAWRHRFDLPVDTSFPGLYLEDHKDGNLGNVRVPKVLSSREDEYTLEDHMQDHAERVLAFRRDHCRLQRFSRDHWGTKSISYRLSPSSKSTLEKELWDLRITIAPDLRIGLPQDDKCFLGLRGVFMKAGSILVSNLSRYEAEAKIPRDFSKRARLLEANFDLYRDRPYKEEPAPVVVSRWDRVKAPVNKIKTKIDKKSRDKFFINANQTLARMGWKDIREAFATVGGVNIALAVFLAITGDVALSFVALFGKIGIQGFGRLGSAFMKELQQNETTLQEDALNRKVTLKYDPKDPLGSRFDPAQQPYWAALTHQSNLRQIADVSDDQKAMMRIINALRRKAGTNMTAFMAGHFAGIRYKEPGGLDVESIPDLGIHFARLNRTRTHEARTDKLIAALLDKNSNDKSFLMLTHDDDGHIHAKALSEAEYRQEFKAVENKPWEDVYKLPHPMPALPEPPVEVAIEKLSAMVVFSRSVNRMAGNALRKYEESARRYPNGPRF